MAYEYKEYPKWVKDKDGKDIGIANNAEEETKLNKKEEPKKSKKDGW